MTGRCVATTSRRESPSTALSAVCLPYSTTAQLYAERYTTSTRSGASAG